MKLFLSFPDFNSFLKTLYLTVCAHNVEKTLSNWNMKKKIVYYQWKYILQCRESKLYFLYIFLALNETTNDLLIKSLACVMCSFMCTFLYTQYLLILFTSSEKKKFLKNHVCRRRISLSLTSFLLYFIYLFLTQPIKILFMDALFFFCLYFHDSPKRFLCFDKKKFIEGISSM
jgi:hypothetical protein